MTTEGWDSVAVGAEPYYARTVDEAVVIAKELCAEWSFEQDPHGYCHERSVLVALLRALERAEVAS